MFYDPEREENIKNREKQAIKNVISILRDNGFRKQRT